MYVTVSYHRQGDSRKPGQYLVGHREEVLPFEQRFINHFNHVLATFKTGRAEEACYWMSESAVVYMPL